MLTERLRQAYAADLLGYQASPEAEGDAAVRRIEAGGLGRAKALLSRLELTVRDLERSWLFLERGTTGAWKGTARAAADEPDDDLPLNREVERMRGFIHQLHPMMARDTGLDGALAAVDETLDRTPKRHFGLRFMRERAQLIGARLDIVSDPATGTTVRLALEPGKRS